ncbi:MAG: RsmF rRNA methyltransferase first C-terminal domain-containing protein [Lachnospiraceae bacterium]|nr:RsmF rRNA methyltransferase first C-terminal domain-containing protein [Lachnospiraceae bacterium]
MRLPSDFLVRMKNMLGAEYDEFIKTYEDERAYGLRFNPLKIDKDRAKEIIEAITLPVPWAEEGFYYNPDMQPGKSPLHEAGAYYIQEPSAMSAAELLEVMPGEIVCDLCAAPGGKSTQIAGKLKGEGLLISNEYYGQRAKILSQNIERMGVRNAIVTNEDTGHMAELFPEFFHKIMVDAPCSGEGMFRKDQIAIDEWSSEQVQVCADRQLMIINNAAAMLKPGGVIVYSTCTFSTEENEGLIQQFLEENTDFVVDKPVCHQKLIQAGFVEKGGMYRLWPHKLKGEGHFAVRLRKIASDDEINYKRKPISGVAGKQELKYFDEFVGKYLNTSFKGQFVMFGDCIYLVPDEMISLKGIKIERAGLKLGCNKKNRFEPDHALALALRPEQARQVTELDNAEKYLKGEMVETEYDSGWTLVTVKGVSLGWGKAQNGMLKNHYPKGLRK